METANQMHCTAYTKGFNQWRLKAVPLVPLAAPRYLHINT